MAFRDRDPTNPIDRKLHRDKELRGQAVESEEVGKQETSRVAELLWDYLVEPVIEAIGLLGLAIVLAVIGGAIYVWISIFLLGRWPI